MWCTRWFLPLLLLPLPTAPPYFLVLFLLALFIQAKPCFYCIVLLVTLFFSSCYWQPFPIDSALSTPWADNVTTFRDALNLTMPAPYDKPLPPVMRTLDRCWCDFWEGGFFDPYNVSQWERSSILKLADQLHSSRKAELEAEAEAQAKESPTAPASTLDMPRTAAPSEPTSSTTRRRASVASNVWSLVNPYLRPRTMPEPASEPETAPEITVAAPEAAPSPLLRWEYDLRPLGLGVVVDFGWNRS